MKMMVGMIASGLLFAWVCVAMETKEKKLAVIKEPASSTSKMKKVSFLRLIFGYVPKADSDADESRPVSKKKKVKKDKEVDQQKAIDTFIDEQNEMSACLGNPDKKNPKYAIVGSILDA